MTRGIHNILFLCLGIGGVSAEQGGKPAQAGGAPEFPLALADALELAERNNPQLTAASATVEGAGAAITTARAYLNPSISFGVAGRQQPMRVEGIPGMLHGMTINQPIERRDVRSTRLRAAEFRREGAAASLSEIRLAVRGQVKRAFYEVLRRTQELELSRGNLTLLEDLRFRIQVQVNVGEAARLELTRAEAEVSSARVQMRSAELKRSVALVELEAAIGAPIGPAVPTGDVDSPQALPPLEEMRAEALGRHPALAVAKAEVGRSEATLENEKAQRKLQPTVWLDYLHQPDTAQIRWGVSLPVPLWNKREGPIAEAVAQQRYAAAVAQQRRVELNAAVERAYRSYEVANQQVEIFQTGTLRQAEAAVEAAQAAFRFGERGILEVLDAQRVLRSARQDFLNAQFDRQQALIDLEQLRAVELDEVKP